MTTLSQSDTDAIHPDDTRVLSYVKAITEALHFEMTRDDTVFTLGEDIAFGGMFTATTGLLDRFGEQRVIDTPISEAGFVGMAAGAAVAGLRPVVELMFVDFALVAADQIINQVAKLRYMSGNKLSVPLTIRTQQGVRGGGGPQHQQSLENMFVQAGTIAIAAPATAADAKGLLATAIRMDEPAIVMEHKGLYFTKGPVPSGEHLVPFGVAATRRRGDHITLIGYSNAVNWCLEAADILHGESGIEAEVIDLRTLVPLDLATVVESVTRTGAAVVVQESAPAAGIGAQLAASITDECWNSLSAPVARVHGLDVPIPYSQPLENRWLPNGRVVADRARSTLERARRAGL